MNNANDAKDAKDANSEEINNINNISVNDEEYTFCMSVENNENIYNAIETMLEQMQHNMSILNSNTENNDFVTFDIEFEFIQPQSSVHNDEENLDFFKDCKEINEKVNKSEKIKKNDIILNEICFICMDNYKCLELKRTLPKCNHYFHKKCIDKWLTRKASCPICRDKLL